MGLRRHGRLGSETQGLVIRVRLGADATSPVDLLSLSGARSVLEPFGEVATLRFGGGELERPAVGDRGLVAPSEPPQEIGASSRQEVIVGEIAASLDLFDE
jgi:hypothetical protein